MPKITGRFRLFLSILIFFVVVVTSSYYHVELINTLLHVNLEWLGAGLLCYGANYILRAFRLRVLADFRINFWPDAIYASSLHGFLTYLIPMQLGDICLPVILKTANRICLSDGSMILLRSRLLDIMSLGGLIIVAAIFFDIPLSDAFRRFWLAIGGCLLMGPFFIRWLISGNWFQSSRMGLFLRSFDQAEKFWIIECLLSLAIWFSVACVFYCVIKAINLPLGLGGALLLITLQLPLQVLPIQGFANTGNHEGGWIAALSLLGIPLYQSAEFAVTSHIIILFYVLALGIVTLIAGFHRKLHANN